MGTGRQRLSEAVPEDGDQTGGSAGVPAHPPGWYTRSVWPLSWSGQKYTVRRLPLV